MPPPHVRRVLVHVHHDPQLGVKTLHALQVPAHSRNPACEIRQLTTLLLDHALGVAKIVIQMARLQPDPPEPDVAGDQPQDQNAGRKAEPAAHPQIAAARCVLP